MKRNERMDAAQGLLQECMSDLRAVERKARQALAWVADEEDAAPGPLMKSVAEFAIGVAHEGEVALNVSLSWMPPFDWISSRCPLKPERRSSSSSRSR